MMEDNISKVDSYSLVDYNNGELNTSVPDEYSLKNSTVISDRHVGIGSNIPINFNSSKYDPNAVYKYNLQNLEDIRSQNQGVFDSLGRSTANLIGKTGINVAGGIAGSIYGIGSAIANGDITKIWDNSLTTSLDAASESVGDYFKVYKSAGYDEKTLLGRMFLHPIQFTDEFMDTLSFTTGAIVTELITAGMASGFVVPRAMKYLRNIDKASKASDVAATMARSNAGMLSRLGDAGTLSRQLATGAAWEASVEARHGAMELRSKMELDWLEEARETNPFISLEDMPDEVRDDISDRVSNAGLFTFLSNMALVGGSNMVQFPKIFGASYNTNKRAISNIAGRVSSDIDGKFIDTALPLSRAERIRRNIFTAAKNPFMEGLVEEGGQGVISGTALSYFDRKNDIDGEDNVARFLLDFGTSLKDTYTTGEGWYEIGMGMLIGSLGSPGRGALSIFGKDNKLGREGFNEDGSRREFWTGGIAGAFQERSAEDARVGELVEELNNQPSLMNAMKSHYDFLVRTNSYQKDMDAAADKGDIYTYENMRDDMLFSFINTRMNAGLGSTLEYLIEDINGVSAEDLYKEFRGEEALNNATQEEINDFKRKQVNTLTNKIKEVRDATKIVDNALQNINEDLRNELIYNAASAKFIDIREDLINQELLELSGGSISHANLAGVEDITLEDYSRHLKNEQKELDKESPRYSEIDSTLKFIAGLNKKEKQLSANEIEIIRNFAVTNPVEFGTNIDSVVDLLIDSKKLRARRQNFINNYNLLFSKEGQEAFQEYQDKVRADMEKARQDELNRREKVKKDKAVKDRQKEIEKKANKLKEKESAETSEETLDETPTETDVRAPKTVEINGKNYEVSPDGVITDPETGREIEPNTKLHQTILDTLNEVSTEESQSAEQQRADIGIGKIPNTEYEVKSDGVYFEGKKLDNPNNLSHRELIEDDIRRRQEEDLEYANFGNRQKELEQGRKNTSEIVNIIKNKYSNKTLIGKIIRLLENLIDFQKFATIRVENLKGGSANGQAMNGGMVLDSLIYDSILEGDSRAIKTFIHEAIHHLLDATKWTAHKSNPKNSNLSNKEIKAWENLERIFEKVKSISKTNAYGLTNLNEFLAEAFSNESFQRDLAEIEGEGKKSNLLKDILNNIVELLQEQLNKWGKRFNKEVPNLSNSILEDIFAWSEDLIDIDRKISDVSLLSEINAKYNAELDAVNQGSMSETSVDSSDLTPDEAVIADMLEYERNKAEIDLQLQDGNVNNGSAEFDAEQVQQVFDPDDMRISGNTIISLNIEYIETPSSQGRTIKDRFDDEGNLVINENFDSRLQDPDQFNTGTEVEVIIPSYQQMMDSGMRSDYTMNDYNADIADPKKLPIAFIDSTGKIIGYLPLTSNVSKRVAPKYVKEEVAKNIKTRELIFNNQDKLITFKITSKSAGVPMYSKRPKPIYEGLGDGTGLANGVRIGISKQGSLMVGQGTPFKGKIKLPLDLTLEEYLENGVVYSLTPTADGQSHHALPLKVNKISPDSANTVVHMLKLFLANPSNSNHKSLLDNRNAVSHEVDFSNFKSFMEAVENIMYINNDNERYRFDIDLKNRVLRTGIGKHQKYNLNDLLTKQSEVDRLVEDLGNRFYAVKLNNFGNNIPVFTVENGQLTVESTNYYDYLNNNNMLTTNLQNESIEGTNRRYFTAQSVITVSKPLFRDRRPEPATVASQQNQPTSVETDRIERRNELIENRRKDSIEKLKSIDNLLAYHYLIQRIGIQNPYGSDTTLLTSELGVSFKEAEELVKRRNSEIKPKGWKLGDDYDTSKLDSQVENALKEINSEYEKKLAALEQTQIAEVREGVITKSTDFGNIYYVKDTNGDLIKISEEEAKRPITPVEKSESLQENITEETSPADIEIRRQEELKNNDITVDDRGDNYYSLIETKRSVISFEERESLIGKKVNFIVKNPNNNKLINNYKGTIIKHESSGITGDLRIDLELDNGQTFSIDRNGNFYTQSNVRFTEEIPNAVIEINAKYDAELAALEQKEETATAEEIKPSKKVFKNPFGAKVPTKRDLGNDIVEDFSSISVNSPEQDAINLMNKCK